jgi:hypothetical protein
MIAALSPGASWLLAGGILLFSWIVGIALARIASKPYLYAPESLSSPERPREGEVVIDIDLPLPPRELIGPGGRRVIVISDYIERVRP